MENEKKTKNEKGTKYTQSEIKETDFARIIYNIRTEHNLTQKQLGELINISDKTISKWENGQTIPDLLNLIKICEELGVSPSALVKSKKTLKDKIHRIKRLLIKFFNYFLKNIFIISFFVFFVILLIYFLNNFNTVSISKLDSSDENIYFENGYLIKNKKLNLLIIDDIKLKRISFEPQTTSLELYTYVDGEKYTIYESDNLDDIFIEERYPDILTSYVLLAIKKNLYLDISITDNDNIKYEFKSVISTRTKFVNNKLAYKNTNIRTITYNLDYQRNYKPIITDYKSKVLANNTFSNSKIYSNSKENKETDSLNKLSSLGYDYDEDKDTYTKIDENNIKIEYSVTQEVLKYEINNNNLRYEYKYNVSRKKIIYTIYKNESPIIYIKYYINENREMCLHGDCSKLKPDFNHILKIYNEINVYL